MCKEWKTIEASNIIEIMRSDTSQRNHVKLRRSVEIMELITNPWKSQKSQKSPEINWNQLKSHKSPEITEIIWNHLKSLSEITKITWSHLESQKSKKSSEIIWNHLKSQKSPEITWNQRNHQKSPKSHNYDFWKSKKSKISYAIFVSNFPLENDPLKWGSRSPKLKSQLN